jgi:endonuclease-3
MARAVVERHEGEIPADLDALTALPGVGRKTAHVVMGNAFAVASGVVVDTHVKRLAARLGLTTKTDPGVIEHELAALTPRKEWIDLSHRLIDHGRAVCGALRPDCPRCALRPICPRVGVADKSAAVTKKPRKPTLP